MPSPFSFLQLGISKGDEQILRAGIIKAFSEWARLYGQEKAPGRCGVGLGWV